ncbi:MAG: hypothetical protein EPO07_01595 [Verrucomicrobia bacterium]|nr:MAG: hypothetical protein EPO07_01595 [Verrucomicrobiota bacterium]
MNPDHENKLAAAVTRELNSLGELPAPEAIAARVMRVIERRNAAPWYRRAWQTWPVGLQAASLAILVAMFAGVAVLLNGLSTSAPATAAAQQSSGWFAQLGFIWNILNVLANAVVAAVNHLGKGVLVAALIFIAAAYAACVGLGTACVRFALLRR